MWQICGYIPQTLDNPQEVTEMAAQLSTTFFIETFIHAKEKVKKLLIHNFYNLQNVLLYLGVCLILFVTILFTKVSDWILLLMVWSKLRFGYDKSSGKQGYSIRML